MVTTALKALIHRDLEKLKLEISQYQDEASIWKVEKQISNSAGNLCLHLVGNLNHFIGKVLGGTDYVRNREAEFSLKDVPRAELVRLVETTIPVMDQSLDQVTPEQLAATYPIEVFGYPMTTEHFLIHLAMHLDYHLGQVNYHRRLLDGGME